ncbi:MAG TPA: alpha-glucan family phosphorylase [bacterium]|nr:alpha-glucan family phosphorylase [bacterium]
MIHMTRYDQMKIAYFSMEIGISGHIPTYSGGLGVLAGDTLRSCADLQLPVIGVSLLYQKGYFHQRIDANGMQQEVDVRWDPTEHMEPLKETVIVQIAGKEVHIRAWLYRNQGITGQINPIIFLDTDLPENAPEDRTLTHHLYGQDARYRLSQEIVLGVGGVRMLEALGCTNLCKYHMNEGHSALLTLELARRFRENKDVKQHVRDICVFTTHTPVPAGHDQFPRELAEELLGDFILPEIREEVYFNNTLNMTHIALLLSEYVNGVAKKHGEVSRDMFPGYHIDSITNGVHAGFWTAPAFFELYDHYVPSWKNDPLSLRQVLGLKQRRIWDAHMETKRALLHEINVRYKTGLNEKIFTLGFARRAATYKRGHMLFSDIERLKRIAASSKGGIQIIYAGKAHPADQAGKEVIKEIITSMRSLEGDITAVYLENYDIETARLLTAGVDVWLNTPERPFEASGTSGMKAALNGVPHFSVLDGWWIEGHIENVTGWSIGGLSHNETDADRIQELDDLYGKLEYIILPTFYQDREKWIDIMRHTIALNGAYFNTHRMIEQYVLNAYFKDYTD